MLHCSLAHGGAWRGLAAQFESDFSFEAPDFLSHGRSAFWDGQGSYHEACTALAKRYLGSQPIDVIGHSFGATVALRVALEAPESVRSLVLIEPVFFAVAMADDPDFVNDLNEMSALLAAGDRRGATKAFLARWGGGLPWEAMPAETQQDMASRIQVIPDAAPALFEDSAGMLAEGRLQALEIPVLLLRGSRSPKVTETINTGLQRRLPNAEARVIAGGSHMLPISHPKDSAAEMRRFWGL